MVLKCEMNQEDCELRLEADTVLILVYLLSITFAHCELNKPVQSVAKKEMEKKLFLNLYFCLVF